MHLGGVWFADAENALPDPEWLVDDMLTTGDKSLVYGASQSGKSFLATHISLGIARGVEVFEHKARRGGVIYIAAEGKKGFKKRIGAYRIENDLGDAEIPFLLVPTAVDLYSKGGDTAALLEDIALIKPMMERMGVGVDLVVVDTLAAVSPGANENASEDMSRILKHCDQIQEVTNGHVMIVHHKNASGERPRGHTSLFAAVDSAIEVQCDEYRIRTAKISKLKDAEDGANIGFKLRPVTIGSRDDGKSITSCVVEPAQLGMARTSNKAKLTNQESIALDALRQALFDYGEPAPGMLKLPHGMHVVHAKHWKCEFMKRGFDEQPADAAFRQACKRAGDGLMGKHIIGRDQPYLWIARELSQ